jgi:acyl-CoA synthetase (AMP-forming)/AMP-acid ligase II
MSTMRPNPPLTPDELRSLLEAEEVKALRASKHFNKVLAVWKELVDAAHSAMESNQNPKLDTHYMNAWRERKAMYDFTLQWFDEIERGRRESIRDLFADMGIDPERIERNLDISLDFLKPMIGGPK